jgi:predicted transcriptional regulator
MIQQNVVIFTDKEEEFVRLLIAIGTGRKVAQVLVFLSKTPEATSRDIDHGTDLRQPEVSTAIGYLLERGWIKYREDNTEKQGRPVRIYSLAISIEEIVAAFEKEKRREITQRLALVGKVRDYI